MVKPKKSNDPLGVPESLYGLNDVAERTTTVGEAIKRAMASRTTIETIVNHAHLRTAADEVQDYFGNSAMTRASSVLDSMAAIPLSVNEVAQQAAAAYKSVNDISDQVAATYRSMDDIAQQVAAAYTSANQLIESIAVQFASSPLLAASRATAESSLLNLTPSLVDSFSALSDLGRRFQSGLGVPPVDELKRAVAEAVSAVSTGPTITLDSLGLATDDMDSVLNARWNDFQKKAEYATEHPEAAATAMPELARAADEVIGAAPAEAKGAIGTILHDVMVKAASGAIVAAGAASVKFLWPWFILLVFGVTNSPAIAKPPQLLPPALPTITAPKPAPADWQHSGLPDVIKRAGPKAALRTVEFFTAQIRNANTRQAYARAVVDFFNWCDDRNLELETITPFAVAAYVEELQIEHSAPTVKQHLAAIRMLFDWLVAGQVIPVNPVATVRGPKHIVKHGKTPVLTSDQARMLLDSIDTGTIIGLRDRAVIGVMVYSFARVSAAASMRVEDFFLNGKRWWLRLHEKGGKRHEVPAHHNAEFYLNAYLNAAGILEQKRSMLFRSLGRDRQLTTAGLHRTDVLRMIKRRAVAAGLPPSTCCHTFRATGITAYLENGGTIEKAQQIAAHESPRTTKLYDRTSEELTPAEIERIII
jgi:integrase/recombinase XerD